MSKDIEIHEIYGILLGERCKNPPFRCKPCCFECSDIHKCMDSWREGYLSYCSIDRKRVKCRYINKACGFEIIEK